MDVVRQLIKKKPTIFLLISCLYFIGVVLLKWWIHPNLDTLWFFVGCAIGIYFLDGAEVFFQLNPSPFRSQIFASLFIIVGLFIVTSSGSALASGLVLSLYLQMVLWQIGEWRVAGNLQDWYAMFAITVPERIQFIAMNIFGAILLFESYIFIRQIL